MCCRYYVESSERTRELVEQMPPSLRSRWERTDAVRVSGEIKPTDVAPVIAPNSRGERAVYPMKWGYALASLVINARVESAAKKLSFADSWRSHRCIIPATYYYEWEHLKDMRTGKEKTGDKYILQTKDKDMTFSGEILIICSIETFELTFYNEFMNEISMVPSLFKFMYGGFYKSTFSFTFL